MVVGRFAATRRKLLARMLFDDSLSSDKKSECFRTLAGESKFDTARDVGMSARLSKKYGLRWCAQNPLRPVQGKSCLLRQ
jgi:hypothetical protein